MATLGWVFVWLFSADAALGQDLRFETITGEDGLSQSVVNDIVQDEVGYLWFATQDGLNRYDGYEFIVFKNRPGDPATLPANHVLRLSHTRDGQLWVGMVDGGLARFDESNESFIRYGPSAHDPRGLTSRTITAIFQDQHGTLWIAGSDGTVHFYQSEQDRFAAFQALQGKNVWSFIDLPDGDLLAGAVEGLFRMNPITGEARPFDVNLPALSVRHLMLDRRQRLWIGTRTNGVLVYDLQSEESVPIRFAADDDSSLSNDQTRMILQGEDGDIWVGTQDGLNRISGDQTISADLAWNRYKHYPTDPKGLSGNYIASLFQDRTGVLWIGVAGKGLNKLTPISKSFGLFKSASRDKTSMSGSLIFSLLEDPDGGVWVATFDGGLTYSHPQTGEVRKYEHDPSSPNGLPGGFIQCLEMDRQNQLWIGMENNGLARFNPSTEHFTHYPSGSQTGLLNSDIHDVHVDDQGTVWVGTEKGLYRFQSEENRFQLIADSQWPRFEQQSIFHLAPAHGGGLWLATNNGLWLWREDHIRHYVGDQYSGDPLPTPSLNVVYQSAADTLWIGSDSGLIRLDRPHEESPIVTTYTEDDGLSNNLVYGMLPGNDGRLWLSTNNGLSRFDPSNDSFSVFDASCGLQNNEFNQGAFFRSPSGKLYFGGIHGFNAFYPENIDNKSKPPALALTKFKTFNKEAKLDVPPHRLNKLVLKPEDTVVTFEFAAFDFANPSRTRYAYKLEGFDPDWTYTTGKRDVTYTNLDPGNYVFRVKAASRGSQWNEAGISLPVRVVPPLWQTRWAYALYVLFIGGAALLAHRIRIRRLDKRQRELTLLVAEKTHELTCKNQELAESNALLQDRQREMETLDETVKAINREETMERLAAVLLEEGLRLCPDATRGAILILDDRDGYYRIAASKNHQLDVVDRFKLPADTAEPRYGGNAEELGEDIFLVRNREPIAELGEKTGEHHHMLTVAIRYNQRTAGFLVLENENDPESLANNAATLKHFREHATSALAKARNLEALLETANRLKATQGELLDAAHLAGMAEIATTVLHNVGNTLNSVKISAQMLQERIENNQTHRVFERLIDLLKANKDELLTFIRDTERGQKVPDAFLAVGEMVLENTEELRGEIHRLLKSVETIQDVVAAQSMHTDKSGLVEELDLNLLLEHMLAVNADTFQRHRITLTTELGELPMVKVDKAKLVYILTNLLNNACDALAKNTGERRIIITTEQMDQDFVRVQVADNGIGIDRQYLDRLFKMGFTTKRKGHGFGLHYCANTIKRMGGGISVESPGIGKGAKSTLWFPHRQTKKSSKRASA